MNKYFSLEKNVAKKAAKLKGPILILGAGGFVGVNLFHSLLEIRDDVYGISRDSKNNWRLQIANFPKKQIIDCDFRDSNTIEKVIKKIKPQTIFNLAAYGAYAKQANVDAIYETNFNASIRLIEILKKYGFKAYVYTGSSSEYGFNSDGPLEDATFSPNSHYAVSKLGVSYAHYYYGKVEKLPVAHARLYSVYGPYEEPGRLIEIFVKHLLQGKYPPLTSPKISRDFIYTTDVNSALVIIAASMNEKVYGEAFNIGTGKKTTIKQLALLGKKSFKLSKNPEFGLQESKRWDHGKDWYANIEKMEKHFGWKPTVSLEEGLLKVADWQRGNKQ